MLRRFIVLFVLMLITASLALALDDQGNENDPTVNDRANACYEDGSMANKCDTPWEWECGWHLIQFEYGMTSREEFPAWCISIIPPEIVPEPLAVLSLESPTTPVNPPPPPTTPSAGCILVVGGYLNFNGGYFLPGGSPYHTDVACTILDGGSTVFPGVYAPAPYDALTLCNLNGTYTGVTPDSVDTYRCDP